MNGDDQSPVLRPTVPRAAVLLIVGLSMVAGMALLAGAFAQSDPDSLSAWALGVIGVWTAGGATLLVITQGVPARAGREAVSVGRSLVLALLVGAGTAAASMVGAFVLRDAPVIGPAVGSATETARVDLLLVLSVALAAGAAEELFFRVGLHRVLGSGWSAVVVSTLLYMVATAATGNAALVMMAGILGAVCATALRLTGRAFVPVLIHASWTVAMVGIFPLLP